MAATKRDKALAAANNLIGYMGQLQNLRAAINDFTTQYNSEGWSTIWGALSTSALAADGSLGATDVNPTATNPINNAALIKSVTKNQLVSGVVLCQQLQNFFGNAVVAQGNYSQTVDDLAA